MRFLNLFPSRYIHIGGDEAVKDEWNASAAEQARARELGIHDSDALQTYFTQTIDGYLSARGRRAVGWDEILQPGLPDDAVVMSWRGVSGARAAAMKGNDTVLSPDPMLYLDHRQSSLAGEPPGRLDVISLQDVYRFEPHDPQAVGVAATLTFSGSRPTFGPSTSKLSNGSTGWPCRVRRPWPKWAGPRRREELAGFLEASGTDVGTLPRVRP